LKISFDEIVKNPYSKNAWMRGGFPGFKEDFLVLHSLIRLYCPERFMEIGTSSGIGTNVICQAMKVRRYCGNREKVFSLDVPPGTDPNIIYPEHEDGHPTKAGADCIYPYTQLFGNSISFDFTPYFPISGWFIDGKHDYQYCSKDSTSAFSAQPTLVVWHDFQIDGVRQAIEDAVTFHKDNYTGFHVENTRIAFAYRKDNGKIFVNPSL
jgi:hypothetical protein